MMVADNMYKLEIEDLAANVFVELSLRNLSVSFLTFKTFEAYGAKVVEILKSNGRKAELDLSRAKTQTFFQRYYDFFIIIRKKTPTSLSGGSSRISLRSKVKFIEVNEGYYI